MAVVVAAAVGETVVVTVDVVVTVVIAVVMPWSWLWPLSCLWLWCGRDRRRVYGCNYGRGRCGSRRQGPDCSDDRGGGAAGGCRGEGRSWLGVTAELELFGRVGLHSTCCSCERHTEKWVFETSDNKEGF